MYTDRGLGVELDTAREHGHPTSLGDNAGVVLGSEHGSTPKRALYRIGIGFWKRKAETIKFVVEQK